MELEELKNCVSQTLRLIGEDVERPGLVKTPERVAKCIEKLTSGYSMDPVAVLRSALFQETYSQPVVVRDIEFYSLCEHHMLPFFGKVHVAYIPDDKIVGLSKIPRIVDIFARRLQVQERMTCQIRQCIDEALNPRGVLVAVEAQHLCLQMRGVEKQGTTAVTIDFSGEFQDPALRNSILSTVIS